MKIAALYDIHGNAPAFNAVLGELEEARPDLIVIGGDIVSGPMPQQTLERLMQLGERARGIRGNADRETVMDFDEVPLHPNMAQHERVATRWVASQLTHSQRDYLASLPEQLEFKIDGLGRVLFCHATPRNDEEMFTAITPEDHLRVIFSDVEQDIVICGHTHMQFERRLENLRIVNAGSVGMPYADQPGAYWLLLSNDGYEFRRTPYDVEAAAQVIRTSRYPQAHEFANENVCVVPTAEEAMRIFEKMAQEQWSLEG